MFLLEGKPLPIDVPFEHGGIQYPANWLRLASLEEKQAIGIVEVADQTRPDDRFYWVTQNPDGSFTATPKDLAMVRDMLIEQIRNTSYTMLLPTDWKLVRQVETSEACDQTTLDKRAAIRAAFTSNLAAINAAADVPALAALQFTWPN